MRATKEIAELRKEIAELRLEIEKLKASAEPREIHNHFHTHNHPAAVPYVQPAWIPPYTFTCGVDNILNDGHQTTCGAIEVGKLVSVCI